MRRTLGNLLAVALLGAVLTGCGKSEDENVVAPPPAVPAAGGSDVTAAAVTAPPPVAAPVAPPDAAQAAVVPGAAAPTNDSDLLGGSGRPLTEEEKMLLNYGIDMFKTEKGHYPATLQEAVASRHITRLPKLPEGEQLNYDAQTGKVTVVKK
ncbi:MAG TPA: hypothetical protein VGH19_23035 [Verrucomicrobiae bacterium]